MDTLAKARMRETGKGHYGSYAEVLKSEAGAKLYAGLVAAELVNRS